MGDGGRAPATHGQGGRTPWAPGAPRSAHRRHPRPEASRTRRPGRPGLLVLDLMLVVQVGIPGCLRPGRGGYPVEQLRGRAGRARRPVSGGPKSPPSGVGPGISGAWGAGRAQRSCRPPASTPRRGRVSGGISRQAGVAGRAGLRHGHAGPPGVLRGLADIGRLGRAAGRPGQEHRAGREPRRVAVLGLVGQVAPARSLLRVAAIAIVGRVSSPVAVLGQRHEGTDQGARAR